MKNFKETLAEIADLEAKELDQLFENQTDVIAEGLALISEQDITDWFKKLND